MTTKKNTAVRTSVAEDSMREYVWARTTKDVYQYAETCVLNKKGELPVR